MTPMPLPSAISLAERSRLFRDSGTSQLALLPPRQRCPKTVTQRRKTPVPKTKIQKEGFQRQRSQSKMCCFTD
ncbi:hypothetical protein B0H19DRAFT_1168132, partial [Mycena capillaripes]